MRSICFGVLLAFSSVSAFAQASAWDTSGNGRLTGAYYFREVIYVVADDFGDLSRALALYGQMTFDGAGKYTINNATLVDSNAGSLQTFSITGSYSINAAGYGFFTHPLSSSTAAFTTFGLVANGILVGSATDDGFNALFVAAPVPAGATNSFFNGSYTLTGFLPAASPADAGDTAFILNADGNGNLGNVNIAGYFGGGAGQYGQSTPNLKYLFSNNAANVQFPRSNTATFYSGNEYLYFSPDAKFVFGGSPTGFDMLLGVKNDASVNFGGLYYEAGLDVDATPLFSAGYGIVDTYYGSFSAGGGNIVGHQRVYTPVVNTQPEGFTYSSTYPSTINNGTYTSPGGRTVYFFGNGGATRIGVGVGPAIGISVAFKAPAATGDGVFLNPMGIANAASAAPFTAGISDGEFLVLYGNNLAPSTQTANSLPFPTTLNGVQVTINGVPAPIYYVSATQMAVIVPYGTSASSVARIQVTNNGTASNVVTEFVNLTTPGLFTLTSNGLGSGAIVHVDGSVVTADNPAKPGETVAMFVAGLGEVDPAAPEGSAGPVNPLSYTKNSIAIFIGGRTASVKYSGLAPYLAGLYQLNVTIPDGTPAGDATVEIAGPDSDAFQGTIPVASASGLVTPGASLSKRAHRAR